MMKQKILESIGILVFSVFLAFISNQFRADGMPLFSLEPSLPPALSEDELKEGIVSSQFLFAKIYQPGVTVLDSRSPEDFREGHIPGAKNLPYNEFSEETSQILKEISLDTEVITYCDGIEYSTAEDLALFLKEVGYEDVRVFAGGWEEWIENGMPVEK